VLALLEPGDEVLLFEPYYGYHRNTLAALDLPVKLVPLAPPDWRFDPVGLEQAIGPRTRGLVINTPLNPCGKVFSRGELEALAEIARRRDLIVFTDEVYEHFVYDGRRHLSPAALPGMRERTVIVSSVSKNYNMMGWRIGWVAGPRELVGPLEDVHIFNGLMPSGFAQAGAAAALAGPQDWLDEIVAAHERLRDALLEELTPIEGLTTTVPEGGYFFLGNISQLGVESPDFCQRLLEATGVALTPMVAWGADDFGRDHVRFIFTNEHEERLREAGALVADFVRGLGG
jgi:aminotransferase